MKRSAALLVWAAATDASFAPASVGRVEGLAGRCIHCGRRLFVGWDGRPVGRPASLEHLVPRAGGGTDDLGNLAVACATCNHRKGARTDRLPVGDPRHRRAVDPALARRRSRFRLPPEAWPLPPRPQGVSLCANRADSRPRGCVRGPGPEPE